MVQLTINARRYAVDAEPDTPLLFVLRDSLGLTGTKYGCGIGQCGACTVLLDGAATRSCQIPLESVGTQAITTIEAIEQDPVGAKVVAAWVGIEVPQCGYCQSGQIMAAVALPNEKPKPTDADIDDAMTNICRCGTYGRIRAAIHSVAGNGAA